MTLIDRIKNTLSINCDTALVRYDLDRIYRYSEYNKTIDYAKKYIDVNGVREQVQRLQTESEIYEKDIKNIAEPEREAEERKYHVWATWFKVKKICIWVTLGLIVCAVINSILWDYLPSFLNRLLDKLSLPLILLIPALIVIKVGEWICKNNYSSYVSKINTKINARNDNFEKTARAYYATIDNLYLTSLDPLQREMVLMRREQAKRDEQYQKEMKAMREENMRLQNELRNELRNMEKDRLQEAKQARVAQEQAMRSYDRMLQIEEDRERRIRK